MSPNPRDQKPGFAPDHAVYGAELCGAAELLSDQMDMAKVLLAHHFPDASLHQNAHVVLDVQSRLAHIIGGPEMFIPLPLNDDDLTGLEGEST